MTQPKLSRRKKLVFWAALVVLTLTVVAGLYLATVVWRSAKVYQKPVRWSGRAYDTDDLYGNYPRKGAVAYHTLTDGEQVPVVFDENGFRVPLNHGPDGPDRPLILFLGDSITHGYGVRAEKTFAYLTAEKVGGTGVNAGGSGWGLSQMVFRAWETIPALKPDLVVVQYSSWLASRSTRYYRVSRFGKSPQPFFFEVDGRIDIHPPLFRRPALALEEYAGGGLLPFVFKIGIPMYAHDDYFEFTTYLGRALGWIVPPLESMQRAVDFTYAEIRNLCAAVDAEMIVLVVPGSIHDAPVHHLDDVSVPVVHVLGDLTRRLPVATKEAWDADYRFWRGDPPRIVDSHPNAHMHEIIAEVLAGAIRELRHPSAAAKTE